MIQMNWTRYSPTSYPYLLVEYQLYQVGAPHDDVLPDGSSVSFSYKDDADVSWEICLRESCEMVTCPDPLLQMTSRYCSGKSCDDSDLAICCSAEPEGLNGVLSSSGFDSFFDVLAPVSGWALDALQQVTPSGRTLCIAEALDGQPPFFLNLCKFYASKLVGGVEIHVVQSLVTISN